MTNEEKCRVVVERITALCNEGKKVSFEEDEGGNSLTICVGELHTHVGYRQAEFDLLVENLYNCLTDGPGLSWA